MVSDTFKYTMAVFHGYWHISRVTQLLKQPHNYFKFRYLISKKSVGRKFRRQKISLVINICHLDKNLLHFTDKIFCQAIYETYYKTLIFPVFL